MEFKKITSLLLAALIAISALPLGGVTLPDLGIKAAAATIVDSGTCGANGDNVTWTLDSDGTLTISGAGEMKSYGYSNNAPWKNLNVINVVIENGVTSIGYLAFYNCSSLASVTIPDGVTSIDEDAFSGCSSLTSITIPASVTSIGGWAFSHCSSLNSITIPDGVTSIGGWAFYDCSSLTSITIPNRVTSIGDSAFFDCSSLTSIMMPDEVTSIGDDVFRGCTGLTSITIPDSVTEIGYAAFEGCTGLTSITIPDSVTDIGSNAFKDCISLTSITIPDGVTNIGEYAFAWCDNITTAILPDSLTSIGEDAFYMCNGLSNIKIPNGVTEIGDDAFKTVANIVYNGSADGSPWGARTINGYIEDGIVYRNAEKTELTACPSTKTGEVIIPDSVTTIATDAFYWCVNLTSVTIPSDVENILDDFVLVANVNYDGFADSSYWSARTVNGYIEDGIVYRNAEKTELTACPASRSCNIKIPDSVTIIGEDAFYECTGLTSISLPDGVTSIGDGAFEDCRSLTSVTIPDGVTSIGNWTFYGCASLKSIILPAGVTSIGDSAFSGCISLTSITIPDSVTSIGSAVLNGSAFYNNKNNWENGVLYCGNHLVNVDRDSLDEKYTVKEGTLVIADNSFNSCQSLTEVVFPDSLTDICSYAFSWCHGLTSVTIPDNVRNIGYSAFYGCESLASITLPDNLTIIEDEAFSDTAFYNNENNWENGVLYCGNNLIDAKEDVCGEYAVKDGTRVIAALAFYQNEALTAITLPDSLTSIGRYAFSDCCNINEITIPANVRFFGTGAFSGCESLTSFNIPDGVTVVSYSLLSGCYDLTDIVIPKSVTKIEDWAFSHCYDLADIYIYNPNCEINDNARTLYSFATIHGYSGSTAQEYAEKYGRTFVPIDHQHEYTVETTKADCTHDGVKTFTCKGCGDSYTEIIPAKGHTWDAGKVTKPAAVGVKGVKTFTCTVCKATRTEDIPALTPAAPKAVEVKTTEKAKTLSSGFVGATHSVKISELLASSNASYVVDKDGKKLTDTSKPLTTGMKLVLESNGKKVEKVIAVLGDIDGNGEMAVTDARLALRAAVGLDELKGAYLDAAKVGGKANVDVSDARLILRAAVQLETGKDWLGKVK